MTEFQLFCHLIFYTTTSPESVYLTEKYMNLFVKHICQKGEHFLRFKITQFRNINFHKCGCIWKDALFSLSVFPLDRPKYYEMCAVIWISNENIIHNRRSTHFKITPYHIHNEWLNNEHILDMSVVSECKTWRNRNKFLKYKSNTFPIFIHTHTHWRDTHIVKALMVLFMEYYVY